MSIMTNPCQRRARARLHAAFAAALVLGGSSAVQAALVASETFNYGATAGSLSGQAGGSGFAAAWSGGSQFAYTPTGLSFGTLQTSGGAAVYTSPVNTFSTLSASRQFASPLSGPTYGSFLFRIDSRSGTQNNFGLLLNTSAGQTDATSPLAMNLPVNSGTSPGRVLLQFQDTGGNGRFVSGAATQLSVGTTYMALFKYQSTASSASANLWLLTSNQYDSLAAAGLTESALSAATIGTGASNLWSSTSVTANITPRSRAYLSLFGFVGTNGGSLVQTIDEVRLSDASLSEVAPATPVPEPSALALGVAGLAFTAAVVRRRRRG